MGLRPTGPHMVSIHHAALVALFRNRPTLAAELLIACGESIPQFAEARIEAAELTNVAPAEYRADLVVVLLDDAAQPVLGVIIEVQLHRDERKRFTWPVYLVDMRARFECETLVVVVTSEPAVASWAKAPIHLGPGNDLRLHVIGPSVIPKITDQDDACRDPELAVLSSIAHGSTSLDVAIAATIAVAGLDEERLKMYYDLIVASLTHAARIALEKHMATSNYQYQSEFARKYVAQGKAEGILEGKAEGEAAGKANALLTFLGARGLALDEEGRARIAACTDIEQLDEWIKRAATAATIAQLFVP